MQVAMIRTLVFVVFGSANGVVRYDGPTGALHRLVLVQRPREDPNVAIHGRLLLIVCGCGRSVRITVIGPVLLCGC